MKEVFEEVHRDERLMKIIKEIQNGTATNKGSLTAKVSSFIKGGWLFQKPSHGFLLF